ncbi:MAG: hypothetical protein M0Z30_08240 [Actinomycetota bacterium]|nr:hypothetical protein [Actinomycetota bacterium]
MASKTVFGAIGVAAALGIGGTAWAATGGANTPSSPAGVVTAAPAGSGASGTSGAPVAANRAGRPTRRSLLERADHATIEIKVKGQWVTYSIDRGKVTSVSPTSITLARPDGQSVTEQITAATKYRGVSGESAIQTGRPAQVVSDGGSALRIRQAAPKTSAPGTGSSGTGQTSGPAPAGGLGV